MEVGALLVPRSYRLLVVAERLALVVVQLLDVLASRATEEHKTRLYHLGHVFGHSVRGAASEHIEDLDDNQSEAFRHYEQAIRTGDQERADLQAEITALHGDVEALRLVILSQKTLHQTIVSRAKYWFVKKKMNYPVWLKDAIQMLAQEES